MGQTRTVSRQVDVAEKVVEAHALSKLNARKLVDTVFVESVDAANDEVSLSGFSKFKVNEGTAR